MKLRKGMIAQMSADLGINPDQPMRVSWPVEILKARGQRVFVKNCVREDICKEHWVERDQIEPVSKRCLEIASNVGLGVRRKYVRKSITPVSINDWQPAILPFID